MKIILESEKDVNKFIESFENGVFNETEVVINPNDLISVIINYKEEISELKTKYSIFKLFNSSYSLLILLKSGLNLI